MIKSFTLTKHSNFRGLVSLIVIGLFLVFGLTGHSHAVTNSGPIGIQISPVSIEVNVDPGRAYTFKVKVLNITDGTLQLTPQVNDFRAKDETGTPAVILDSSLPSSSSLQSWITLSDPLPFQLAPKDTKPVIVNLNIPKDAEAGGHYGIVRFSGAGVGQNSNVSLIASTGTLVLVRVSGNITEQLHVVDFYTSRHGTKSGWFEKSPINFTERINNTGNVHVNPQGNLTITNMFGKQVGSIDINSTGGNILPNSTRRFDQIFSNNHMFGHYTAKLNLAYGTKGETLSDSLSFWVIPYKLIALTLISLIVVIGLLVWSIRRYNRKIINKALHKQ